MFEVGKKYKGSYENIIEVLFVGNTKVFCKSEEYGEMTIYNSSIEFWKEYKEPIKSIKYIYLRTDTNIIYSLTHPIQDPKYKFLSVVEMSYSIHNGLKVEVIKGIG